MIVQTVVRLSWTRCFGLGEHKGQAITTTNYVVSEVLNRNIRCSVRYAEMRTFKHGVKKLVMIAFGLTVSCAAGLSLKSQDPAPLQSGVNSGIVDNFVGPHYWYFVGGPGDVHVVVRFKSMGLFGNPILTPLTFTLFDEQRTWHLTKVVTSENDISEQTFTGNWTRN
jgi:hypothetical protein